MEKFKPFRDGQCFLLPPSLAGFVPGNHLARVILSSMMRGVRRVREREERVARLQAEGGACAISRAIFRERRLTVMKETPIPFSSSR